MPKQATGEIRWRDGLAIARVTLHGKQRASFALPSCREEAAALERARVLADAARRLRIAQIDAARTRTALDMIATATARSLPNALAIAQELAGGAPLASASEVPTFGQVAAQWTSGALHARYPQLRQKRGFDDEISRLKCHILPTLKDIPIDRVTLDLCEEVLRRMPKDLEVGTVRNAGQIMARVLRLAVSPLRLIERSPIPDDFLPAMPKRKAMAYLHPDEDQRLMACGAVPLEYRLLWGFLVREGMREGEALTLTWGDFDLKRGSVRLDENKTDDPRVWALHPGVATGLRRFRERYRADAKAGDLVFRDPAGRAVNAVGLASILRRHLRAIGLHEERPELFVEAGDPSRRRIRVHDLRATFVTLALAHDKSEAWVARRTGHRSSQMINRYKRNAATFEELDLGELMPLDEAIPELNDCPRIAHGGTQPVESTVISQELQKPDISRQPLGTIENPPKAQEPELSQGLLSDSRGQSEGNPDAISGTPSDAVEAALADALTRAAQAGQWGTVETLSRELTARREARAGVVELKPRRRGVRA